MSKRKKKEGIPQLEAVEQDVVATKEATEIESEELSEFDKTVRLKVRVFKGATGVGIRIVFLVLLYILFYVFFVNIMPGIMSYIYDLMDFQTGTPDTVMWALWLLPAFLFAITVDVGLIWLAVRVWKYLSQFLGYLAKRYEQKLRRKGESE